MEEPIRVTGSVASPYGDRSLAETSPQLPWRGTSLALLMLALALFFGAGVTVTVAAVRIFATANQETGADIGVGLTLVLFISLVLSACGVLSLAYRTRRSLKKF